MRPRRPPDPEPVRGLMRRNPLEDRAEHQPLDRLEPRLGRLDQPRSPGPLRLPAVPVVPQWPIAGTAAGTAGLAIGEPVKLPRLEAQALGQVRGSHDRRDQPARRRAGRGGHLRRTLSPAREGDALLALAGALESRVLEQEGGDSCGGRATPGRERCQQPIGQGPEPASPPHQCPPPARQQRVALPRPGRQDLGQNTGDHLAALERGQRRGAPTRLVRREGSYVKRNQPHAPRCSTDTLPRGSPGEVESDRSKKTTVLGTRLERPRRSVEVRARPGLLSSPHPANPFARLRKVAEARKILARRPTYRATRMQARPIWMFTSISALAEFGKVVSR